MSSYQKKFTETQRKCEADRIISKYPHRIPIICERAKMCSDPNVATLDKKKYLVPKDLRLADFMYVIRKRMKLSPDKSIFLFLGGNNLAPCGALLGILYDQYKDKDGFLYVTYNGESTFG
jgi:GABA(A) receptor-associated protein